MKKLVKELMVTIVCVFGVILIFLVWDWTDSLFLTILVGLLMIGVACLWGMVTGWITWTIESGLLNKVREVKKIEGDILTNECIRQCPSCDTNIELAMGTVNNEILECPGCRFELEVVFDPSKVNPDEVAKGHEGFDPSWIDLSVAPTLVPSPMEEEAGKVEVEIIMYKEI